MNHRIGETLTRAVAILGLLLLPRLAVAQLQCADNAAKAIRSVSFIGNTTFTDNELADHIIATPTDLAQRLIGGTSTNLTQRLIGLLGKRRCLQTGLLGGDLQRLKAFYVEQGFPDARVDTLTTIDGRWADILFAVKEGQPVTIDSLAISGFDTTQLGKGLMNALNSKTGTRYSAGLMLVDVDTIEIRMRNSGYPKGTALYSPAPSGDHRVIATITILPGPRATIGKITINSKGVDKPRSAFAPQVIHDILQFREGDVYRERALYTSERQFYRLGNFLSAAVTADTTHVEKDSLVDVTVDLTEDQMHEISHEEGIGTLDCLRARLGYTDKAFAHGLNRFELNAQASKIGWASPWPGVHDLCNNSTFFHLRDDQVASNDINYNVSTSLTRPITFRGILPSASVYTERRGAFQSYTRMTILGVAATASKSYPKGIVAQSSYNIEYGRTDADEAVLCFLFRACDESARDQLTKTNKRLAILGLSGSRDVRDYADSTTAGSVVRVDLRTSAPFLGSDRTLGFRKGVLDASGYRRPFGSGVFAVRIRGGVIGGGEATAGARLPPPQERLYTGGETSVRGFSQNELGPLIYVTDDTTGLGARAQASDTLQALQALRMRIVPTGGNTMVVANFEYRVPGPFFSSLQTILFADMGKLWSREVPGAGVPKWTPGIAFRYFSPFGPVQINIAYNQYSRPAGPVFFDGGVDLSSGKAPLVCLTGAIAGSCQATFFPSPPTKFLSKLKFSIAFPPDF